MKLLEALRSQAGKLGALLQIGEFAVYLGKRRKKSAHETSYASGSRAVRCKPAKAGVDARERLLNPVHRTICNVTTRVISLWNWSRLAPSWTTRSFDIGIL